jgi:hypothetical protein
MLAIFIQIVLKIAFSKQLMLFEYYQADTTGRIALHSFGLADKDESLYLSFIKRQDK